MFGEGLEDALHVHDLRRMARKRLPRWLCDFVASGAEDEVALRNNRAASERIKLKTQVLVDVSKRRQGITLSTLWGATVGGEAKAIRFFREEISRTIACLGCGTISDRNRGLLEYGAIPHVRLTV